MVWVDGFLAISETSIVIRSDSRAGGTNFDGNGADNSETHAVKNC